MIGDKEGNIQFFSRAAEEITGYRKDEVIGKQCALLESELFGYKKGSFTGAIGD